MSIDPLTAAANLVDVWSVYRPMEDDELFGRLSCGEVEPLADIFRAMNANELADQIIEAHAHHDDDPDDMHHDLYLLHLGEEQWT